MHPAVHLFAPLALLVPTAVVVDRAAVRENGAAAIAAASAARAVAAPYSAMGGSVRAPGAGQVRIEQRVTIRIGPSAGGMPMMPPAMLDDPDFGGGPVRMIERKLGRCLAVSAIAGVSPGAGNRLLLLLRDSRVVSATLDKSCRGRDYYSGFLVARNADGMICIGRDQLLARSGANCKVSGFRQLIGVED